MTPRTQGTILVLLGVVLLRLALFGEYLNYVRAAMRPFLLATAVLLVALGVVEVVRGGWASVTAPADEDWRRQYVEGFAESDAAENEQGHDDEPHPGAWLLCIPAFLVLLVPPPALGSYMSARAAATVRPPPANTVFHALPAGLVQLSVRDYAQRAVWDDGRTLRGRTISLTGFVTPGGAGAWYVTRLQVRCCAADALPTMVEIHTDVAPPPTRDTWVTVTGSWLPSTDPVPSRAVPRMAATSVREVRQPGDPYE